MMKKSACPHPHGKVADTLRVPSASSSRHDTTVTMWNRPESWSPYSLWPYSLWLVFLVLCLSCNANRDSDGEYPERPVKIIVPFGPGGGSDTFARILQDAINRKKLLDQKVVIVNVPGAGATIGSRRAKNAPADGYTILHLHDAILTAKLSGVVAYGPEEFEPIAGTGRVGLIITVHESSPYDTLTELLDETKRKPDSVLFAANIGAPSHFAGLMLEEKRPGATFRYTQSGGGAKRLSALSGGHVHVSAFSTSEYKQYRSAGLKALAYFGAERHPDFEDIPTAREQGFDVLSDNIGFWWAPKGTPKERLAVIAATLEKAMALPGVLEQLEELSIEPIVLRGDELQNQLRDKQTRMAAVAPESTYEPPNVPLFVAIAVLILAIGMAIESVRLRGESSQQTSKSSATSMRRLIPVSLLTIAYVSVLQAQIVEYRIATVLYIAGFGWLLADKSRSLRIAVCLTAVGLGLGVHFAMTQVFFIDLP